MTEFTWYRDDEAIRLSGTGVDIWFTQVIVPDTVTKQPFQFDVHYRGKKVKSFDRLNVAKSYAELIASELAEFGMEL